MYGDEASFWLDGTLYRTWARIGHQPHVDTFGQRKTAHVFGALSLEERPHFYYHFAGVFKGVTFLEFLKKLVCYSRRKIFLIIDNGPCHNLDREGKAWLAAHRQRIELFRLPQIHRDPFDRLILATAQEHGWILISKDQEMRKYEDVRVVW